MPRSEMQKRTIFKIVWLTSQSLGRKLSIALLTRACSEVLGERGKILIHNIRLRCESHTFRSVAVRLIRMQNVYLFICYGDLLAKGNLLGFKCGIYKK